MWLIQNYTTVALSVNPVQKTDGMFPSSWLAGCFWCSFVVSAQQCECEHWEQQGRDRGARCHSRCQPQQCDAGNDWCGAALWQMGTKLSCMQGNSDFSLLPDSPALQPGWGIFQEVGRLGDNEGHVRKPISLNWLQRKPLVIRLDIDIKFLDGSLSHFNSLEDCSSHLKICT